MLFFYPLDFTFVCPTGARLRRLPQPTRLHGESTHAREPPRYHAASHSGCPTPLSRPYRRCAEITAFSDRYAEFKALNTEVRRSLSPPGASLWETHSSQLEAQQAALSTQIIRSR